MALTLRSISGILLIVFTGCVTSWDSGYRPTPQETIDIYTAVLQWRLARTPLPRRQDVFLFLEPSVGPAVSQRFPDYHVILRSGSEGSSPPHARWYHLRMWRYTPDKAFVMVFARERSGHLVELRKRDGRWMVVDDQEMIITQHAETPNQAMQRSASQPAICLLRVCHPPLCCVAPLTGLAVANLMSP